MARFTFRLPDIGEGIAEAEIVAWHVKVGDRIEEDGSIADMMTDKATVEMESPVSGIVIELAGAVGDMVPIGSALAVIEVEGEEQSSAPAQVGVQPSVVVVEIIEPLPALPELLPAQEHSATQSTQVLASPAVRDRKTSCRERVWR